MVEDSETREVAAWRTATLDVAEGVDLDGPIGLDWGVGSVSSEGENLTVLPLDPAELFGTFDEAEWRQMDAACPSVKGGVFHLAGIGTLEARSRTQLRRREVKRLRAHRAELIRVCQQAFDAVKDCLIGIHGREAVESAWDGDQTVRYFEEAVRLLGTAPVLVAFAVTHATDGRAGAAIETEWPRLSAFASMVGPSWFEVADQDLVAQLDSSGTPPPVAIEDVRANSDDRSSSRSAAVTATSIGDLELRLRDLLAALEYEAARSSGVSQEAAQLLGDAGEVVTVQVVPAIVEARELLEAEALDEETRAQRAATEARVISRVKELAPSLVLDHEMLGHLAAVVAAGSSASVQVPEDFDAIADVIGNPHTRALAVDEELISLVGVVVGSTEVPAVEDLLDAVPGPAAEPAAIAAEHRPALEADAASDSSSAGRQTSISVVLPPVSAHSGGQPQHKASSAEPLVDVVDADPEPAPLPEAKDERSTNSPGGGPFEVPKGVSEPESDPRAATRAPASIPNDSAVSADILDEQFAVAAWKMEVEDRPIDADVLRMAGLAFAATRANGRLRDAAVDAYHNLIASAGLDDEQQRCLLIAALRLDLVSPYSAPLELLNVDLEQVRWTDAADTDLVARAGDAVRMGVNLESAPLMTAVARVQQAELQRDDARRACEDFLLRESKASLVYQRATRVWQAALANDELGRLLRRTASGELDTADVQFIADIPEMDVDEWIRDCIHRVDEAVSKPGQLNNPIESRARTRLEEKIRSALELLAAALDAEARLVAARRETPPHERQVVERLRDELDSESGLTERVRMADALVEVLRRHLRTMLAEGVKQPLNDDPDDILLLPLVGMPNFAIDAEGRLLQPDRAPTAMVGSRGSAQASFAAACERGDLRTAAWLLRHASALLDDDAEGVLTRALDRRHDQLRARALEIAAQLQWAESIGRAEPTLIEIGREFQAELEELLRESTLESERHVQQVEVAAEKVALVETMLEDVRSRLRDDLLARSKRVEASPEDRARVLMAIESGNLAIAEAVLDAMEAGAPAHIPGGRPPVERLMTALLPELETDPRDLIDLIGGGDGPEYLRTLAQQAQKLHRSESLAHYARNNGDFHDLMTSVLKVVGIETAFMHAAAPDRRAEGVRRTFEVRRFSERGVAAFRGDSPRRWDFIVVKPSPRPAREIERAVVQYPDQNVPKIIYYPGVVSASERRVLAERMRSTGSTTTVVVDDAVIAAAVNWGLDPRECMSLMLPFTAEIPYFPVVSGNVPSEVYFGRERELQRILDMDDTCVVYGGRQMGKSALLVQARSRFDNGANQRALLIDLLLKGVGAAGGSVNAFWKVLADAVRGGGIGRLAPSQSDSRAVLDAIRHWLDDSPDHRLILLLDEADAFLIEDQKERGSSDLNSLLDLMHSSGRRFKPVFAGLQDVQRLSNDRNGQIGKLGDPCVVGPLPWADAWELVQLPTSIIGVHVEDDAVRLILALTHRHPALLQILCHAVVGSMHQKRVTVGEPPYTVTSAEVERTFTQDEAVRRLMLERFHWTVTLDPFYTVIAYSLAAMSEAGVTAVTRATLLEECQQRAPRGFGDMNLRELDAFLDELVSLGILFVRDDAVRLATPNVLRLLGSRREIEARLIAVGDLDFSLPQARVARPAIAPGVRSPLMLEDLKRMTSGLLSQTTAALGMDRSRHVVIGTEATNLSRVPAALRWMLGEVRGQGTSAAAELLVETDVDQLEDAITAIDSRVKVLLVVDASSADAHDVMRACDRVSAWLQRQRAVVLLVDAADVDSVAVAEKWADPSTTVVLRPWTDDSLRTLASGAVRLTLQSRETRARILDLTGGWDAGVSWLLENSSNADVADLAIDRFAALGADATPELLSSLGFSADSPDLVALRSVVEFSAADSDHWPRDLLVDLVSADSTENGLARVLAWELMGVVGVFEGEYCFNPQVMRCVRGA